MEGKGEFEEYSAAGHDRNREGSLKKRLEGGKGQKKAHPEGYCSHWCSRKQEEGRPGKKKRMVTVRETVVFRGFSAVCRSRGDGGEGYWKGLQGDFQPHWENGKKQILNWDRATQNGPSAKEREKQETQNCWRGPEETCPCAEGQGEAENSSKATASNTAEVTARPGRETRR